MIAGTPQEIPGTLEGGGEKQERQAKQEPAWEVLWAGQAGACPCVLTRVPLKAVDSESMAEGILPAVADFGPPKAASAGLASQIPTERGVLALCSFPRDGSPASPGPGDWRLWLPPGAGRSSPDRWCGVRGRSRVTSPGHLAPC